MSTNDTITRTSPSTEEPESPSETDGPVEPEDPDLNVDRLYHILSNRRRRFALYFLQRTDDGTTLAELTEHVAAWESGCDPDDLSSDQRKRVYTALQQSHLPTLEKAAIVQYDEIDKYVEPTESLSSIDCYPTIDRSPRWSHYYLGLSALFGLAVALMWLSVWPMTLVPEPMLATALLVAFGAVALVQWHVDRTGEPIVEGPPPELNR